MSFLKELKDDHYVIMMRPLQCHEQNGAAVTYIFYNFCSMSDKDTMHTVKCVVPKSQVQLY